MLNVDDITKLLLAVSVSFAIVALAVQLARLLGQTVEVVKEAKNAAANASEVSDLALEDYKRVRGAVDAVSGLFQNVSQIRSSLEFISNTFGGKNNSNETKDEDEAKKEDKSSKNSKK